MTSNPINHDNLIELLPVELLPQILFRLDCFSLRSLLQAYPQVARHCLLIVEHRDDDRYAEPGFFNDCIGLKAIASEQYRPSLNRAYILKIFTMASVHKDYYLVKPASHIDKRLPFLNREDSMVIYFPPRSCFRAEVDAEMELQHALTSLFHQKGVSFHVGPPTSVDTLACSLEEIDRLIMSPLNMSDDFTCETRLQHLTSARLEGIECVSGVTFSARLKALTVVFNKDHLAPELKNLVFLGLTLQLSIYYDEVVPFMTNLTFPSSEEASNFCLENTLVLGHLPSLTGNITSALPTHPDEGRDFRYLSTELEPPGNLSFVFVTVRILGGPTGLVEQLNTSGLALGLEWKQTCQPKDDYPVRIASDSLMYFKFETLLKHAKFPMLVYGQRSHIKSISAIAYNGLHIDALVESSHKVQSLCLYVATKNEDDYVPSISQIWPGLTRRPSNILGKIVIVGLKRSPQITQQQLNDLISGNVCDVGLSELVLI